MLKKKRYNLKCMRSTELNIRDSLNYTEHNKVFMVIANLNCTKLSELGISTVLSYVFEYRDMCEQNFLKTQPRLLL